MLIHLTDDLISKLKAQEESSKIVDKDIWASLNNIAMASREGNHLVAGSREAFCYLRTIDKLGSLSQSLFDTLSRKTVFTEAYTSFFKTHIRIESVRDIPRIETLDNNTKFIFPLIHFCNINRVSKTKLVSENYNDCFFYHKIAEYYLKRTNKISLPLSFEYEHGGGDTTHLVFTNKISNKYLVIAIADNDKEHPNGQVGETIKKLIRYYESCKEKEIAGIHLYTARAMECLVPPSFYLLCSDVSGKKHIQELKAIEDSDHYCERLLFLNPQGMKKKQYEKKQVKDYFRPLIERFP